MPVPLWLEMLALVLTMAGGGFSIGLLAYLCCSRLWKRHAIAVTFVAATLGALGGVAVHMFLTFAVLADIERRDKMHDDFRRELKQLQEEHMKQLEKRLKQ